MQEIGINWSMIPKKDSWQSRIETYLDPSQVKSRLSYNTHDITGNTQQWGGTGVLSHGKLSHFSMGAGSDLAKLGRWTWARYRGKGGAVLRVVSIYQPCKNTTGELSVWAQQHQYLQEKNDTRNPRQAFMQDLKHELQTWIDEGDHIIIGGDINESVFHHSITTLFGEFGIRNLIFELHEAQDAPKTYFRSSEGRIIDGLWGTPAIQIQQGGYLEPGDFPGDHSMLWIDVSYESALGHEPPLPVTPQAKRLRLSDSKATRIYLRQYKKYVAQYNLKQRQLLLESKTQYGVPLTSQQAQEANAIDHLRTRCMIKADKQCRKLKMGAVSFSEATSLPIKRLAFWDIAIKRRKGQPVQPRLWSRKKKAAGITNDVRIMSLQDMYQARQQARQDYKTAKKEHAAHRVSFLDSLTSEDRKRVKRNEEQRKLGRIAKLVTGKLESKSVTRVEHNGEECTTKATIEAALMEVNAAKIRASEDTAFLLEPLLSEFGYDSHSPNIQRVLDGTYTPPPGTDPYARLLLQQLQHKCTTPANRPPFQHRTKITTDDHIKGWRKAKEKTSAGLSRITFGMFKANATDRDLADIDASMRSLAYTTGHSYTRWKQGLDQQLMKRKKNFSASKQRTILLLEADFNMNNKVLGADTMRSGERMNDFTKDNYAKRGLQAVEVSMNAHLTMNSIWGRRLRAIFMSNDAKGCYDRIAHVVCILALLRLGMSKPAIDSMIATIQQMDHFIRTAFGESDTSYGNEKPMPPQGLLQGNGAGPAGWYSISSLLMNIMREQGYTYKTWSLIKNRALEMVGFAFVDDTDLVISEINDAVPDDQVIAKAQAALTTWEGLIRATGGDLAPEKGHWCFLKVIRHNGKWTYARETQTPGSLFLKDGTHEVRRKEVYVADEALGIQIRPDGKMRDEAKYLLGKALKWCDVVRTKRLEKAEAWYSLNTTIMKTIEYPLTATSLTRKQVDAIMKPIFHTVLRKCGVQRNLPRKLVYGTLKARGLGIRDPYWSQLILHLLAILRHSNRDTPSHDLLQDNMELVQFHIGAQHNFWELPYEQYGVLAPNGWVKHTWEAISQTSLILKGPDLCYPRLRVHDQHIMDGFVYHGYDKPTLQLLNDCRLHLQAVTLADITTACGSRITTNAWNGKRSKDVRRPQWTKTYKPPKKAWKKWKSALRKVYLTSNRTHQRLQQPLGRWLQPYSSESHWIWWRHEAGKTLYERRTESEWYKWEEVPRNYYQRKYCNPQPIDEATITGPLHRASVKIPKRSPYVTVLTTGLHRRQVQTPAPTNLQQRIRQLPPSSAWSVQHLLTTDDGLTIANAIRQGTALAISDGSLKLKMGTSAYVLEGATSDHRITAVNRVPGPIKAGDSHRCELAGLYGILTTIQVICQHHNVTTGTVRIACDNTAAINVLLQPDYLPDPRSTNFDLVNSVWKLSRNIPILWQPFHVKGHMDDIVSAQLTREEKLNVEMDVLAGEYWRHIADTEQTTIPPIAIQHEGWQIWSGDNKIVSPNMNNLYDLIQTPITQFWWVRHHHIPAAEARDIDWDATSASIHSLPNNRRRWITKMASANIGVSTTLQLWNYQTDDACPRCGQTETTQHVYQCTGYDATTVWNQSMKKVKRYMFQSNTKPSIAHHIVQCLNKWRNGQQIDYRDYHGSISTAIRQQTRIGWHSLLESLPSKRWQRIQLRYYRQENIRRSSQQWIKGLLNKLHHLAWHQWEHRNHIKHKVAKPRFKAAVQALDREITREMMKGPDKILRGDRHHFRHNLLHLLSKPLTFKKRWLVNVVTARQTYERRRQRNAKLVLQSQEQSSVMKWMRGIPT